MTDQQRFTIGRTTSILEANLLSGAVLIYKVDRCANTVPMNLINIRAAGVGRLLRRYPRVARYYTLQLHTDEKGQAEVNMGAQGRRLATCRGD